MERELYDRLRFLERVNASYLEAVSSCRVAVGLVDSTPGAHGARKPIERAISTVENLRKPVIDEIATLRAQLRALEPELEGFRSF